MPYCVRGCHKDTHPPPFFYYAINSLMFKFRQILI